MKNEINNNKVYIDAKELANRLSVSVRTIRSYMHQASSPLPAYQLGQKLLFYWPEVQTWVNKHKVTVIEVDSIADEILIKIKGK